MLHTKCCEEAEWPVIIYRINNAFNFYVQNLIRQLKYFTKRHGEGIRQPAYIGFFFGGYMMCIGNRKYVPFLTLFSSQKGTNLTKLYKYVLFYNLRSTFAQFQTTLCLPFYLSLSLSLYFSLFFSQMKKKCS